MEQTTATQDARSASKPPRKPRSKSKPKSRQKRRERQRSGGFAQAGRGVLVFGSILALGVVLGAALSSRR